MNLWELDDQKLSQLIENRWTSSEPIWSEIKKITDRNGSFYDCEMNDLKRMPEYLQKLPVKKSRVKANRIFVNVESVINALIANPPKPNILPGRNTPQSIELARLQERYFINKYAERNVKETLRKGLRNLYLSRLIVLKPFWNAKINDFDVVSLDPRKVRFAKDANKEEDSEFAIEEVETSLESLIAKFPKKKKEILKMAGETEESLLTSNPQVTYKECWIKDLLIWKYQSLILGKIKNPYWDWDGLLVTPEEQEQMMQLSSNPESTLDERKALLSSVRDQQDARMSAQATPSEGTSPEGEMPTNENQTQAQKLEAYRFNHFDHPRKPYIFATVLNNENCPIGRTDFITQAAPLQEAADRRKRQMDDNAELMNGIIKVDSACMDKSDAQKLRYEASGIIYGKGVATGVVRETGTALPQFIFDDMVDSRNEIDNIMAASSAFRGEREGQETKAGRLALIEQSFLRLNELVQTVDFVSQELFNWFYQLAKVRYTETHYAKSMGEQNALQVMEIIQDDFEDGSEVRIIPGKTLPEDAQFKFDRAQADVQKGIISPVDYLKEAGYQDPVGTAKNAEVYKMNPPLAVGMTPEEVAQVMPAPPPQLMPQSPAL